MFDTALFLIAILSGATASVVGFGIGSLLTPLLAARFGTGVAVAAVVIPHGLATAMRCWRLRENIDGAVLRRFGAVSAAGGLLGALLYARLGTSALNRALGLLLLATAAANMSGHVAKWRPRGAVVTALGFLSGAFGGLAGNQGGLRAAALSAFDLSPAVFVATATATALLVDAARLPVYAWRAGAALIPLAGAIMVATAGVVIGTVAGERVLFGLSRERFRRLLSVAIGLLGAWFLVGAR